MCFSQRLRLCHKHSTTIELPIHVRNECRGNCAQTAPRSFVKSQPKWFDTRVAKENGKLSLTTTTVPEVTHPRTMPTYFGARYSRRGVTLEFIPYFLLWVIVFLVKLYNFLFHGNLLYYRCRSRDVDASSLVWNNKLLLMFHISTQFDGWLIHLSANSGALGGANL